MSSDVQNALTEQQRNDYGSIVILAAVAYDYSLTLRKEVTYIWNKPRSWVTVLFFLIRYAGLVSVLTLALCTIAYLLGNWAYPIFWAGADMVMILRVYAMYNRSRLILRVLLLMYITEMAILFTESAIYSHQTYASVSTVQLLDISVCNIVFNIQTWNGATTYAQFVLAVVMCILVAALYVKHSLQMYRTQRTWQPNKYISLLVRDGLLYFLVTLLYTLLNLLGLMNLIPVGWTTQVLTGLANIPLYTLSPRFVMNVRELYARSVERRGDRDIDTGFGMSAGHGAGESSLIGTMAFAEGGGILGEDDADEIPMIEDPRHQQATSLADCDHARAADPPIVHA